MIAASSRGEIMTTHSRNALAVLLLAMLACTAPSGAPTPTVPAAEASTTPLPSATALPSETPLPTATFTPTVPIAWPKEQGVNCRYGYGTEWSAISALLVGQTATIQGRNADSSWWYVVTPSDPGTPCWVASSVTNTGGNLANLPVIPQSSASVTNVTLELDPEDITLPGCFGPVQPIEFAGGITVNGPAEVKWHFETQAEGSMSTHTTDFDFADTKTVDEDSFSPLPAEGSFWVRLVITEPNNRTAEATYEIDCP
jgi:hypothetical protein